MSRICLKVYRWLYVIVFLGFISFVNANEIQLSERAKIGVLTVGTSDESHALYGHTAVLVDDAINGVQRVYNFGLFDFDTPNFAAKFTKGDLLYFGGYTNLRNFIGNYVYENRSVDVQILSLSLIQKQRIFDALQQSVLPENSTYLYKFIDQNCTTKVVDILNSVLEQPLEVSSSDLTYRTLLDSYVLHLVWNRVGINLALAQKTDEKIDHIFLPQQLMESLQVQRGLVEQTTDLLSVTSDESKSSSRFYNSTLSFIALCFVLAVLGYKFKLVRNIVYIVLGILGGVFIFLWSYSSHMEFQNNSSLLLCNPLFVLLPFLGSYVKVKKYFIIFLLFCLLSFLVLCIFSVKFTATLPLFLLTLVLLLFEARQNKKNHCLK